MRTEERRRCPNCFQGKMKNGKCEKCGFESLEEKENHLRITPFARLNDRYIVGRMLGHGGFGITYKAYDTLNQCVCAIKEFLPQGLVMRTGQGKEISVTSTENIDDFEHGKKRFIEEGRILMKLGNVMEVVQIYDSFQENNTVYLVMEYVEGVNLSQLMRVYGGRIPVREAVSLVYDAGYALEQVHNLARIFHRDISPDNIMVTREGGIKIIDFGNAKYLISEKSQMMSVVLKHGYAPPEQYSSMGKQGSYTDVYSLAATLYYIITGERIPIAPDRLGGNEYIRLSELNLGVPDYVSEAVDKALETNRKTRTQTMGEFIRQLKPVVKAPYVMLLEKGRELKWKLPQDQSVMIGRSEEFADIIPGKDGRISKRHCELCYDSILDCFCIIDHSMNGTFAKGKRLEKEQIYDLQDGEIFTIGRNIYVMKVGMEK